MYFAGSALKVAVTVLFWSTVTVQVPVPEHPPPDQPVKIDPEDAEAVSVTTVPESYDSLQSVPQLIPDGELVVLPLPLPDF